MARPSTIDHARSLENTGFESQQAIVLIEVMEDILGTPLTQEMFDAKSDALTANLLAKLDIFSVEMKSFKDAMEASVASL